MHFGVRNGKKECDLQNVISYLCCAFIVALILCSFYQVFTIICVFTVIIEQNVPDKESQLLLGVLFFLVQEKILSSPLY